MADFEPKTWTADATDENVIRASDCERWQNGVDQFGGSWPGSWEDGKDTLTAEQLTALETEISKFNSSFTVKTYSDGAIPGVDEWNRIEEGIVKAIEGHTWEVTYAWSDDFKSCVATFTDPDTGDTETVECVITSVVTAPTCTEQGYTTFTATATLDNIVYTDTAVGDYTPATGHTYGAPEFEWSSDYTSCDAVFTCTVCGDKTTVACTMTSETKEPTCTEDGATTYTATVEMDEKTYSDERSVTIPATGHKWGEPAFEWASDYKTCQAVFTCEVCKETTTVDCDVSAETIEPTCTEDGSTTYTATVEMEGKTYSDEQVIDIPATGHQWGDPEWDWAEDYTSCQATFTCAVCKETQTVDCTVSAKTVEPTCTEDGSITYTAVVEFDDKSYSDEQVVDIPATGHKWGDPEWDWSADYTSCQAVFTCEICGDKDTVDCTVTEVEEGVYTATCTHDGTEYSKTVEPGKIVAFAIYSDTDSSLTFYSDSEVPEEGGTYNGKNVTAVYTGFDTATYTSNSSVPWYSNRSNVTSIVVDSSFANVRCVATAYWFYGHSNATTCTGLEYMDTSSVTTMTYMFRGCSGLTTLDVSNFDTSKVTNMSYMFSGCSGLTTLDVSNFDTSKVTNMSYMFYGCSGLTTLDVSNFDTSKVTNMSYMFYGCSGLTTLDVSNFDTSKVTTMTYMFYGCSGLTTLDVSNFDTSKVTTMTYMFRGCSELTTIYSDDSNFVTTKVTSGNYMFTGCTNLVGGNGTAYDSSAVTYTMAHVDTADNPGYFTAKG